MYLNDLCGKIPDQLLTDQVDNGNKANTTD